MAGCLVVPIVKEPLFVVDSETNFVFCFFFVLFIKIYIYFFLQQLRDPT